MWPSNHNQQQWPPPPPQQSNPNQPQMTAGAGGQQMIGYEYGNVQDQSHINPYQPQQQQFQMQNQIPPAMQQLPQMQNQMIQQNQMQQFQHMQPQLQQPQQIQQAAPAYYGAQQGQVNDIGVNNLTNFGQHVPPPPPPPPPPMHVQNTLGNNNNNMLPPTMMGNNNNMQTPSMMGGNNMIGSNNNMQLPPPPPPRPPPPPPNMQKFYCELCNVACPNEFSLQQHVNGEKHKKNEALLNSNNRRGQRPTPFHCELCGVFCSNQRSLNQHMNGKEHKKKAEIAATGGPQTYFCKVCNVHCPTKQNYDQHLNGLRHRSQLEGSNAINDNEVKVFHCKVCNVSCQSDLAFAQHINGDRHKRQVDNMNDPKMAADRAQGLGGFYCQHCNVTCSNEHSFSQHMKGKKHQKKMASLGLDDGPSICQPAPHRPPSAIVQLPPSPSNTVKDIRPVISKSNAEDEDDSDEEGEIDEEKEIIEHLYEEIEEAQQGTNETKDDDADSDVDDMFGDEEDVDVPKGGDTIPQQSREVVKDESVDNDMKMEDDNEETRDTESTIQDVSSESMQQPTTDSGIDGVDHNLQYEMDDYETEMFEEEGTDDQVECNHESWSEKLKNIDKIGNARTSKRKGEEETKINRISVKDEDDDMEMFGSTNNADEVVSTKSTTLKPNKNVDIDVKQKEATVLDSGLGFVLDYSPATTAHGGIKDDTKKPEPNQGPGFVLDYSGDTPIEGADITQGPQVPQEEDDENDMFGDSSDDDDSAREADKGTAMTASDALAAARIRASRPNQQTTLKRAKTGAQPHQPVKVPEAIPQYAPKRSYYPPVHPDKYWSDLRNWDFVKELNNAMKNNDDPASKKIESGAKRSIEGFNEDKNEKDDSLPEVFESVEQYKALWAPLLINEAKAQLLSEVVASQSTQAWVQRDNVAMGVVAKVELSTSARDHHSSSSEGVNSSDQTVVVRIRAGVGVGHPIHKNDLLLFVHQSSTVKRALQGKAFEDLSEVGNELLNKHCQQGRLGFVGHAINQRDRSVDGLLVRVAKKCWSQFSSLNEMFIIRIGSNVTAIREFNALSRLDSIPLSKYVLNSKLSDTKQRSNCKPQKAGLLMGTDKSDKTSSTFDPLAAEGNSLPVGFRIYIKSKMNASQQKAITASATEYGDGGFTLIKGPPGTGKSTTLVSILNALHLRQYQEYYNAIEKIITESTGSETYYEELAALNKAAEVKPRILVCAPSNAGIDNVVLKIMSDKFVDGQGGKYSPNIIRVGAGTTNPKCESVSLKRKVDAIIEAGSDTTKLEQIISAGRQKLKTIQKEIHKLRARIIAMVECCPYAISADWEIRIDEASFDSSGRVVFVNHTKKTTTFDIPAPKQPHETTCDITQMPHYRSLLKSLTKYVERHNNETSNLEKYIVVQNAATAKMEGQTDDSIVPQIETHVLNSSHIVLTTLGSSGGRAVESANKFKVVVIDEAAQSAEPSTLVALLLGSSHAILVGDPQQLPATIFSVSGRSTKYDRSLFQRLEEGGHKVHLLNTQYRMNPVISEFPRHIFYEGMLVDGPNVQQPDYGGNLKILIRTKFPYVQPFNIFDLDSKEEREGTSLSNKSEAQLVLQLYRTLDRETDGLVAKSRVAVITPYSQQVSLLHRFFSERYGTTYQSRVEISSVDGFQGREANIVIFSCVRAAAGSKGIGFLSDVQRMNVALTRAKHFLFVIARKRSIMVNPYWRKLVGYAKSKNAITQVPIIQKQQTKPAATLKSSLIRSPSRKKVSFGGEDKRLYDINSNPQNFGDNELEGDMFPDLTKLVPMLETTDTI